MTLPSTKERARGLWRSILPRLGVDARFLTGHNCPCPICGGTDRFRFIDHKGHDGDGMWVCNQCTPRARPAIDLVMKFTGLPFKDAMRKVDLLLQNAPAPPPPPRPSNNNAKMPPSAYALRIWAAAKRVQRGDVVDRWLRSRSVGMDVYPDCLRTSDIEVYANGKTGEVSVHPAMIALICRADGKPVAVHRTYLAPDGMTKAAIDKPRKAAGRFGPSPTIRLAPLGPTLGLAEGLETALAAERLFSVPTWSVLSTYGVETFEPPPGVGRLIVFGDHDSNGAGQRAAKRLTARMGGRLAVEVRMPEQPNTDWNDVLRALRNEAT